MRQRVLQATIITVLLAVLMLGIPLGVSWLTLARQSLTNQANKIVDTVRIDTEARVLDDGAGVVVATGEDGVAHADGGGLEVDRGEGGSGEDLAGGVLAERVGDAVLGGLGEPGGPAGADGGVDVVAVERVGGHARDLFLFCLRGGG